MFALAFYYVRWHYSRAVTDLVNIVRNFIWFFYEFFSIPLMLKTLFSPFQRLSDNRKKRNPLDFEAIFEGVIVSGLMRLVGATLRLLLVAMGILFILLSFLFGVAFLLMWLAAPFLLAFIVIAGLTLIVAS